jgi:hypothetical protein
MDAQARACGGRRRCLLCLAQCQSPPFRFRPPPKIRACPVRQDPGQTSGQGRRLLPVSCQSPVGLLSASSRNRNLAVRDNRPAVADGARVVVVPRVSPRSPSGPAGWVSRATQASKLQPGACSVANCQLQHAALRDGHSVVFRMNWQSALLRHPAPCSVQEAWRSAVLRRTTGQRAHHLRY